MRVLVLSAAYPEPSGSRNMYYVHTRNTYYRKAGIEVEVLNFSAVDEYQIDGIKVFPLQKYEEKYHDNHYDILILHAANIRYHYKFIKKYGELFPRFLFFFHGHEVLRCSKVYPKPYDYVKEQNFMYKFLKDLYDIVKLRFWKNVFLKYKKKSWFVFVSHWMLDEFTKWVHLTEQDLDGKVSIIYNGIGSVFEEKSYRKDAEKRYDYVSIRSDFDGSKYGVDIIVALAKSNPEKSFHLIGKGDYFKHREKPQNLTVDYKSLSHDEMLQILDESRCALMPTRTDAQGVMACEMATYGIPMITSSISVCQEVFSDFSNVGYFDNENTDILLEKIYETITVNEYRKNEKYFEKNTSGKEVELLKVLCNSFEE